MTRLLAVPLLAVMLVLVGLALETGREAARSPTWPLAIAGVGFALLFTFLSACAFGAMLAFAFGVLP